MQVLWRSHSDRYLSTIVYFKIADCKCFVTVRNCFVKKKLIIGIIYIIALEIFSDLWYYYNVIICVYRNLKERIVKKEL